MSSLSSIGSSNLNSNGIQFSGLASGIDTGKLIEGLVSIQKAQVTRLQNSQAKVALQQTSFKGIEAKLLTLEGESSKLSRTFSSVFNAKKVTNSQESLVSAAASSSATPGVYTFRVNNLARAEQVASQGFASATNTITQGTFQLRVGSGATTSITIDGTNNSLQGLASAINAADSDVSATVIKEGSGADPYRLLLTAKKSGAANTITITNNLADSAGDAVKPNLATTVQQAADASITLGSGPGALTVTSETNQVSGVFSGVTLNLLAADSAKEVTVTVANDIELAKKGVQDFVAAFNDFTDFVSSQTGFDGKTGQGGALLGNASANSIQDAVTRVIGSVVGGVNGQANRLSTIGITLNDQGKLEIDEAKLDKAINGQIPGMTLGDVRRLFVLDGESTNPGVQFISVSSKTKLSTPPPMVIHVSQAAKQAAILATSGLGATTVIGGANNSFTLMVNGRTSGIITLAPGSYTPQALAQELQAKINADSSLEGARVAVGVENSKLKITSENYGSTAKVTIGTGSAVTSQVLGFAGTETGVGTNVAGHYVVKGVMEAATGNGQFLVGKATNASTADLQVRVTLDASQVQGGNDSSMTLTRGIASQLGKVIDNFLDPVNGRLKSIDQSFQDVVDNLQKSIDRQNVRIEDRTNALVRQFAAMESAIAQLKSTGDFLTGQFASLKKLQ